MPRFEARPGGFGLRSIRSNVLFRGSADRDRADRPGDQQRLLQFREGGEPPVTNTPTNSHSSTGIAAAPRRFCINVYRNSTFFERGCIPSASTYYTDAATAPSRRPRTRSPTERWSHLPDPIPATGSSSVPCAYRPLPLVDPDRPQPAGPDRLCGRHRDLHEQPGCADAYRLLRRVEPSLVCRRGRRRGVRLRAARQGLHERRRPQLRPELQPREPHRAFRPRATPKTNSFDCTFHLGSEADGPVYLCAIGRRPVGPRSRPDGGRTLAASRPTSTSSSTRPPGKGGPPDDANLAENSCGSVILDRAPPTLSMQASDTPPLPAIW